MQVNFRPVGELEGRSKPYRGTIRRSVSCTKFLRGGTEARTSICAKLRSVTSPDPNGDEEILQLVDELIRYEILK